MDKPLQGRTIAVPETRQQDVLAELLAARGAQVLRCPLVRILDPEDFGAVDRWLGQVCEDGLDAFVILTGEGLRRLVARARALRLQASFVETIAACRTITRGPKPAAALRELGLRPTLPAPTPTSEGVIEALRGLGLRGHRVGVQYYGQRPVPALEAFLRQAGAQVLAVFPYRYAGAAEDRAVLELVTRIVDSQVDAIVFTSSPQVARLFDVARAHGRDAALREALARCTVAAVGPVVAQALRGVGIAPDVMPDQTFAMKPLVTALAERLRGDG